MIYLVSTQTELFNNDDYTIISPDAALNILNDIPKTDNKRLFGADTETERLDFVQKKILTIQLGNEDFQIVWDCNTVNISLLKDILEDDDTTTIWWNSIFDLPFLYKNNIFPKNIYDGMLAEQLLYNGLNYKNLLKSTADKFGREYTPFSLKTAVRRYCNEVLDKSVRGKIINVGLTPEVVVYAAKDVKYEIRIRNEQLKLIRQQGLDKALAIENKFAPCLAYFKYCGVKLDTDRWRGKMSRDIAEMSKYNDELNNWVINYYNSFNGENGYLKIDRRVGRNINGKYEEITNNLPPKSKMITGKQEITEENGKRVIYDVGKFLVPFGYYESKEFKPFVYTNCEGDLFDGFDTGQYCSINWNSPQQLIVLFEFLGFNLDIIDKKTKQKRKSVSADIIQEQKEICDISIPYIKYKKAAKICQSYGQKWLDMVNIDGRIHPEYHQLGTNTGRISSGDPDDPDTVSILTLPKDFETRACFIAEDGNSFISEDFRSEESRILADVSQDPAMLDLYNTGCGDMHSLVASKAYKRIIGDCPVEEIKERFPKQRQDAKKTEFNEDSIYRNIYLKTQITAKSI